MKTKIELDEVRFKFFVHNEKNLISVVWMHFGAGTLNGKHYSRLYRVHIEIAGKEMPLLLTGNSGAWSTSLQCNLSNSIDFIKEYLKDSPVSPA